MNKVTLRKDCSIDSQKKTQRGGNKKHLLKDNLEKASRAYSGESLSKDGEKCITFLGRKKIEKKNGKSVFATFGKGGENHHDGFFFLREKNLGSNFCMAQIFRDEVEDFLPSSKCMK